MAQFLYSTGRLDSVKIWRMMVGRSLSFAGSSLFSRRFFMSISEQASIAFRKYWTPATFCSDFGKQRGPEFFLCLVGQVFCIIFFGWSGRSHPHSKVKTRRSKRQNASQKQLITQVPASSWLKLGKIYQQVLPGRRLPVLLGQKAYFPGQLAVQLLGCVDFVEFL